MTRILVTGASGFIGTHVLRALQEQKLTFDAPRIDLLRDASAWRDHVRETRPTHMLHLAWYAVPGRFYTAPENYDWPGATMSAVRAFAEAGGTRLTVAGTAAEYAVVDGPCSETTTPLVPATPYGVAKDATRRLLESFAAGAGLSMAWARPFFVYGPGERSQRLVPAVIHSLLAGEDALCSAGTQVRDFVHVRDVAEALVAILLSDVRGAVNVGTGTGAAVRDVVTLIGQELGATDRIRLGALESRPEPAMIVADTRRLNEEVGWRPRYDLRSGIADTIAWWRREAGEPHELAPRFS